MNIKYFILFFIFTDIVFSVGVFAQENNFIQINDSIQALLKNHDFESAKKLNDRLKNISSNTIEDKNWVYKNYFIYYFKNKEYDSCSIFLEKINKDKLSNEGLNNYYFDLAYLFKGKNQLDSSAYYFNKSLVFFENEKANYSPQRTRIYAGLYSIYRQLSDDKRHLYFLKRYLNESIKLKNNYYTGTAYNNLGLFYQDTDSVQKALDYFKLALINFEDEGTKNTVYQNIGSLYLNKLQKLDSAKYYLNKAKNKFSSFRTLAYIEYYLSVISLKNKDFEKENQQLNTALTYIRKDNYAVLEQSIYLALSENYKTLNNYKKSLENYKKYNTISNQIKESTIVEKVEEIQTKYETEKKEKENIQLQNNIEKEKRQKRNLWIGSLVILIFGGITTTLFLKNSKRKRLLAEKNNVIEKQKVVTLLKEQELTSIDAMIEGQEKERKRIAEDLHDDLGSVLTTLKLHFENYKLNKDKKKFSENELIEKTDDLLDEAYTKVRSIAHAKNSGVIANQGLLVAIENMAEKVSSSKKIEITVLDYGLENRLENSLELTIFRIIQELITNIIKHAAATEATIHLTNHDNSLNIMVEDNGVGFDTNHISNKGMGIHSIDKRIEHLDGTMTIESELNKGTTVIIDIPI